MLILAGVSLNALVGDNGIITNSIDAKMKSGMAALEEWLQEKYVDFYNDSEKYENKPELLASKINNLFLKQGTKNYITSAALGNGVQRYYLINKETLPKEIKEGLVGGNTVEYNDYINFIDVYGVTEDLKVYYCEEALNKSVMGIISGAGINPEMKLLKINEDKTFGSAVKNALGLSEDEDVTVGKIQNLTELTLDGILSTEPLSECYSLKKLTIKDTIGLTKLSGVSGCSLLEYLFIDNSTIGDYSEICSNTKLKELYVYSPDSILEVDANLNIQKLCDALENGNKLSALERFGIAGERQMFDNVYAGLQTRGDIYECGSETNLINRGYKVSVSEISNISNLSCLEKINGVIKKSVNYLYIHNNKIGSEVGKNGETGLFYLKDFSEVKVLAVMDNYYLPNLNGLENMTKLKYLYAYNCYRVEKDVNNNDIYAGLNDISSIRQLCGFK